MTDCTKCKGTGMVPVWSNGRYVALMLCPHLLPIFPITHSRIEYQ